MFLTQAKRKLTTWLAVWMLLFGVLLPVASHAAISNSQSAEWVEVCSSTGMLWVRPDTGETSKQKPAGTLQTASSHCLGCVFHAHSTAIPPVAVNFQIPELPHATWRLTSLRDPVLRHFEVYALVRAPPFFS